MKSIEIFTDGGCKGNPGPGGYGCIIRGDVNVLELKGSRPQTTNNIMEMTAAIVALKELSQPYQVALTTDLILQSIVLFWLLVLAVCVISVY